MSGHAPDHWSQYVGPNGWFGLRHPPAWAVSTTDGTATFALPGGVLTISSFWMDPPLPADADDAALETLIHIPRLFPQRRKVRQLNPLQVGQQAIGIEGESPVDPAPKWWQIFQKTSWRKWRIWCCRQDSVCVLALYLQAGSPDPETETLVVMALRTLSFSSELVFPPEVFVQKVVELAHARFPLLACEPMADFQLQLGESRINLFNFYRSYLNAPDQFEAIVMPALATVVQVQGWGKEQTEPDFDEVRERIMPMLYPEDVWRERFPNFIGEPWVGGLVVLYVVDEAQAYWYIRDELLASWGMTADELHELAIRNIDRYFEEQPMEFTLAGSDEGPRLLIPSRPDAYNTARLLSDSFHGKLRDVMGGDFAVGTPSRDFFVAVSLESPETIEHVRTKVGGDFKQMDHPLSDRLLLVTYDGVTEYAPWV